MSDLAQSIVTPAPAAAPAADATPAPEATDGVVLPVVDPNATPEPPAPEDDMSSRFAALSRKEKHIRDQEEKIKADVEKYKGYSDLQERAKSNPMELLNQFGIDLDTLITASLGEDAPPPSVEDQIQALRDEITKGKESEAKAAEDQRKADADAKQADIDEAVLAHQNSITDHLGQNTEKYELINLTGNQNLVWEVTEAHFNANEGEVLTPEQASEKVEAYLEDQVRSAMKLNRFQEKKAESTGFEIKESDPTPERKESPTLTQSLSSPAQNKPSNNSLSMEDSRAAAASLLKWD